ncbi:hypothetical protein [Staphylococcus warneri]|uniref:hypothetical protein n=1 Tax=Staphylococcus warneri TaxID=1292 RepID=UPI0034CF1C6B
MKFIKIGSLILAGGVVLSACSNDNSESGDKESNKSVSNSTYQKLPYHKYYDKKDVKDGGDYYYVVKKKALDAEKKILKDTKGAEYLKANPIDGYSNEPIRPGDYSLDLKGNQLENDAIKFKINNINKYTKDDLKSDNKFKLENPSENDNDVVVKTSNNSSNSAVIEDNGGVVEVDFEYTNKDKDSVNLSKLLTVVTDDYSVEPTIIDVNGSIDGKKIRGSNSDDIDGYLSENKVSQNKTFKGKIVYGITRDDISKNPTLIGSFKIGSPLQNDVYKFKKEIK